jgi:hypothetical protein
MLSALAIGQLPVAAAFFAEIERNICERLR